MELNRILLLVAAISVSLTLWRSIVVFPIKYNRGWIIVSGLIVICTILSLIIAPSNAGIVAGILWLLLIVIPSSTEKIAQNLVRQNRYRRAIWIARIASLLHPFDGWGVRPRFYLARKLESESSFKEAAQIFAEFRQHEQLEFASNTALYTIQGQWEEYVSWLEGHKDDEIRQDPSVLGWYLRALGEVGELNKMVDCLAQYRKILEKDQNAFYSACQIVFAFCGQVETVEKLSQISSFAYQPGRNQLWIATAQLTAGQIEDAQHLLTELQSSYDARTRNDAETRLTHQLPLAHEILTPESELFLQQLQSEVESNLASYSVTMTTKRRVTYATQALIVINVTVFGLELVLGGSTNIETLYRMGALWTPAIVDEGQFWRLLSANFLHFGWLHLLMNMYVLYFLGSSAEIRFGTKWYIFIYTVSGLGSMAIAVLLVQLGWMQQVFAVGASGAILGLLGAITAAEFRLWLLTKSTLAQSRLRGLAFAILIQLLVKLVVPQVSLTLHLSGVIIGFAATMLIESLNRRKVIDGFHE